MLKSTIIGIHEFVKRKLDQHFESKLNSII